MVKSKKNKTAIAEIVMVIIGALVGAGFASGQEIYTFFYKTGIIGVVGILLSTIIISYTIYKVLKIIQAEEINDYKHFLAVISSKSNTKIIKVMDTIINILLLISFFIMIAGFGAYFQQEFNLNSIIGSGILAVISFLVLINNIEGVIKINNYMVPILILIIVLLGFLNFPPTEINKTMPSNNFISSFVNAILYASYNLIMLIPMLITIKNKVEKRETKIALLVCITVFLLAMSIFLLLINTNLNIAETEMPAVYVISQKFSRFKNIYGLIILASIFTTSIALGISFLNNTTKNKNYPQVASIMCIISLFFSKIGFSNLINILYPIFGVLGLVQIYLIKKYKKT